MQSQNHFTFFNILLGKIKHSFQQSAFSNQLKIIFFLVLFSSPHSFSLLNAQKICNYIPLGQGNYVGNANIDASDYAGIEKYLARSIVMEDFQANLIGDSMSCENYAQEINMLADLNAAWVFGGTYYYGTEWDWAAVDSINNAEPCFNFSTKRIKSYQQIVKDINAAYDSKSLRRPIIDAFIPEDIDSTKHHLNNNACDTSGIVGIEKVRIPPTVINAFKDQMSANEKKYYFDEDDAPKNLNFKLENVAWRHIYIEGWIYSPDACKIEGRMWLFFICKQFIDMGYTSINLSQINILFNHSAEVAGNIDAKDNGMTQDEKEATFKYYAPEIKKGYYYITLLCEAVRKYAKEKNTFMLLTTQSDRVYYAYEKNSSGDYVKKQMPDGNFIYLFDINDAAMRPREVDKRHTKSGRNIYPASQQPITIKEFDAKLPACTGLECLKATIDPGSGVNYERGAPGYHISNKKSGRFFLKQPMSVRFDGGVGRSTYNLYTNGCAPWSGNRHENLGTWGYDDARWWYEFVKKSKELDISEQCAADWLKFQYQNVRTFENTNSTYFFSLPGRLLARYNVSMGDTFQFFNTFKLWQHPNILNAIKNDIWKVSEVQLSNVSFEMSAGDKNKLFTGTDLNPKRLISEVLDPDKNSIYSWHIVWADGFREIPVYGTKNIFLTNRPGSFKVALRQDNLGLSAIKYPQGAKGIWSESFFNDNHDDETYKIVDSSAIIKSGKTVRHTEIFPEKNSREMTNEELVNMTYISKKSETRHAEITKSSGTGKKTGNQFFYEVQFDSLKISWRLISATHFKIEFFSPVGKILMAEQHYNKEGLYSEEINLAGLERGNYFLRIICDGDVQTFKMTL